MKQIRIDLLAPVPKVVVFPPPPEGVRVGPLRSEISNGPIGDSLFFVVEVAAKIAPGIVARFIYERVAQYDAKRVAINRRDPADQADFERIVADELEIGKND